MKSSKVHKAGFVNIIGKPNAGKSTLMNGLVGENLSIITSKAQTTRHRILGIVNGDNFQIVFSDTPGFIKPAYKLHNSMMKFVETSLEDADVVLFLVDVKEKEPDQDLINRIKMVEVPVILLLNKVDLIPEERVPVELNKWKSLISPVESLPIAAIGRYNLDKVFQLILKYLPENPPFYPKDQLTDQPERFFVAEIIREKIFKNYRQEIPYSTEVKIESFKEEERIIRISALIFVERKTQKSILIGKGGEMLKKVGTEARLDMEEFLDKKVFLEMHVKVKEGWRDNPNQLRNFGYEL